MIETKACEVGEDIKQVLSLLRLSGRAFAMVLGTSSPVLFSWIDGKTSPLAVVRFTARMLADGARAANEEQRETLRTFATRLPTNDGQALTAMLEAVSLWKLQQAPLVQVPASTSGRVVHMRDRKKPASALLSEAGPTGARRGTSIAAPSHRTRATG